MNDAELATLTALVGRLREACAKCRSTGLAGYLNRAEGIEIAAEELEKVILDMPRDQPQTSGAYAHIQAHDSLERYGTGHPNEKQCPKCGMVLCDCVDQPYEEFIAPSPKPGLSE